MREVTLRALEKWYKKTFEKVGWMVLAEDDDKIQNYSKKINLLIQHLEQKIGVIEENDRKRDLKIMIEDAKKLNTFFDNTFKNKNKNMNMNVNSNIKGGGYMYDKESDRQFHGMSYQDKPRIPNYY